MGENRIEDITKLIEEIGQKLVIEIEKLQEKKVELNTKRESKDSSYKDAKDAKNAIDLIDERINEIYEIAMSKLDRNLREGNVTKEEKEGLRDVLKNREDNLTTEYGDKEKELEELKGKPPKTKNKDIQKTINAKESLENKKSELSKILKYLEDEKEFNILNKKRKEMDDKGEKSYSPKEAKKELKELANEKKSLNKEIEMIKEEIKKASEENQRIAAENKENEKELEKLQNKKDNGDKNISDEQIAEIQSRISDRNSKRININDNKNKLQSKKDKMQELNDEIEYIKSNTDNKNNKGLTYKEKGILEELSKNQGERRKKISEFLSKGDNINEKIEEIKINIEELEIKIQDHQFKLDDYANNISSKMEELKKTIMSLRRDALLLNDSKYQTIEDKSDNEKEIAEKEEPVKAKVEPEIVIPRTSESRTSESRTSEPRTDGPTTNDRKQAVNNERINYLIKPKKDNIFKRFGQWIKDKFSNNKSEIKDEKDTLPKGKTSKKIEKELNKSRQKDYSREMVSSEIGISSENVTDKQIIEYAKQNKKEIKKMMKEGNIVQSTKEQIEKENIKPKNKGNDFLNQIKNWPPDSKNYKNGKKESKTNVNNKDGGPDR